MNKTLRIYENLNFEICDSNIREIYNKEYIVIELEKNKVKYRYKYKNRIDAKDRIVDFPDFLFDLKWFYDNVIEQKTTNTNTKFIFIIKYIIKEYTKEKYLIDFIRNNMDNKKTVKEYNEVKNRIEKILKTIIKKI